MAGQESFTRLSARTLTEMERGLESLLAETRATCALFVDESGFVLARRGNARGLSPTDLSAIAAGCFRSFALLVAQEEMTIDFHAETALNMHFVRAGRSALLLTLFDGACNLAQLRAKAQATAAHVRSMINLCETEQAIPGSQLFITSKLDELFKDI